MTCLKFSPFQLDRILRAGSCSLWDHTCLPTSSIMSVSGMWIYEITSSSLRSYLHTRNSRAILQTNWTFYRPRVRLPLQNTHDSVTWASTVINRRLCKLTQQQKFQFFTVIPHYRNQVRAKRALCINIKVSYSLWAGLLGFETKTRPDGPRDQPATWNRYRGSLSVVMRPQRGVVHPAHLAQRLKK